MRNVPEDSNIFKVENLRNVPQNMAIFFKVENLRNVLGDMAKFLKWKI